MGHKLFLLLCLVYTGVSYAQFSTSPFTRAGIGESGAYNDPLFGAYGNASVAVLDSTVVNINNPSGYALLSKGQPLFSIGLSGRYSMYNDNGAKSNNGVLNLNQIVFAVPANKYFGFAFGLQPFSRKGYEIYDAQAVGGDSVYYKYEGSGTTNKVFAGASFQFLQTERHSLGIGANYGFVFGSVTDSRYSYIITATDSPGGLSDVTYRLHSGYLTLGMNYNYKLDYEGNKQLKIAAAYSPQQQLSANRDAYLLYSDTAVFNETSYSILSSVEDDKGTITQPANTSLGFSYTFRPVTGGDIKLKSVYSISVFGEVNMTRWSAYGTDFREEQSGSPYENTVRYSAGMSFTPNFNYFDKAVGKSYFRRVRYRVGGYYGTMPYVEEGSQLTESGVTAGLGFPIAVQRTNSAINMSFQYGKRGTGNATGLSENFVGFNIGVIIAPANYDRWFRKTKLD